MIIQGTNAPLIFTFSESMTNIKDIEISLYNQEKELKHWSLSDVTINNKTVTAPIRQAESVAFPKGKCNIEVKWMDQYGKVNFAKDIPNSIIPRTDKTIMEGEST